MSTGDFLFLEREQVFYRETYDTKRISFFVSNKDKLSPLSRIRSNIVYEASCPGCGKSYIDMTKRCLSVRLNEQATQVNDSAIGTYSVL